jgi:hypothetical protein
MMLRGWFGGRKKFQKGMRRSYGFGPDYPDIGYGAYLVL